MKGLLILFYLLCLTPVWSMDLSIQYSRFHSEHNDYIEFNYYFIGKSITDPAEISIKPSVQMTMIIRTGDRIIYADKFNVIGIGNQANFSAVKRYGLKSGTYTCSIDAVDNNNPNNVFSWSESITIEARPDGFSLSDIQLLSSIKKAEEESVNSKNGFVFENLPFMFSRAKMKKIHYYLETYNSTELGDQYHLKIELVEHYANRPDRVAQHFTKTRKSRLIDIIMGTLVIRDLPSGNYKVKFSVMDDNTVVSDGYVLFQHSNNLDLPIPTTAIAENLPFSFLDSLSQEDIIYSVKALIPRINSTEVEAIDLALKSNNLTRLKYLLKYHWSNFGDINYEASFNEYMAIARAVDNQFDSGYGSGFETDRGYYYLKFGRPDHIIAENNDLNAPPYEIWTYNELPELQQTNVKFVFYNPSLAPGNFVLLHSTAKGEHNNPRWRLEITYPGTERGKVNSLEGSDVEDGFRQNSGRYYDDN